MFNFIQNENMKIYSRTRTWVMMGTLVAAVILASVLLHQVGSSELNWQQAATKEIESLEHYLNSEKVKLLPEYQIKDLENQIKTKQYALEHNIPPANQTIWGNTSTLVVEFMQVITIFVAIIAADIVASEFSRGTIKLLLIRPVNRLKILLSKYAATMMYSVVLMLVLFLSSLIMGGILYGFSDMNIPFLYVGADGSIHEGIMLMQLLKIYALSSIQFVMIVTISFMISTVFRSSAMAIGLSLFILFTGTGLAQLLSRFEWSKYFLFTNTDLTMYIKGIPMVEGMTLQFSIMVLVIYFIAFNFLSYIIFQKRDVTA